MENTIITPTEPKKTYKSSKEECGKNKLNNFSSGKSSLTSCEYK